MINITKVHLKVQIHLRDASHRLPRDLHKLSKSTYNTPPGHPKTFQLDDDDGPHPGHWSPQIDLHIETLIIQFDLQTFLSMEREGR